MAITITDSEITGIAYGGLNDGILSRSNMGYSGCPLNVDVVINYSIASFSVPVITAGTGLGNPGTSIVPLEITCSPSAGNKIVLEWRIMGESSVHNMNYVITRNDTIMTDSADTNRWSGITTNQFDRNYDSTAVIDYIRFVDNNCLGVSTVYRLHVRSSGATAGTFYLNSTVGATQADDNEIGQSIGIATEYKA